MRRILDLFFTSLWRVIRILIPHRDPPGFIQGAVDRVSVRQLRKRVRPLSCVKEFVAGSAIEIGDAVSLSADGLLYPIYPKDDDTSDLIRGLERAADLFDDIQDRKRRR